MITSLGNQKVRQVIALNGKVKERKKEKLYIVEGMKMFEEAPLEQIQEVFLLEEVFNQKLETKMQEKLKKVSYELVSTEVFQKISDTKTPQGILCIMKQPIYSLTKLLEVENPFFLILEDIQDPGNLGTMIRTGEGAGITGVIMTKKTVDIFNSKVIRSTMGSIYRVPYIYIEEMSDILEILHVQGVQTYAAYLGKESYFKNKLKIDNIGILIGNESQGLKLETAKQCKNIVSIPMAGQVESLNAAMSAGILMYEVYKQRMIKEGW